ncbi:MAG: epoxyqueuosine reductase QueH [Bacteroidales bacterium]|nr:epoxyqueuosine reductase QueH [Bacteroidales bacterium]
MTLNPPGQKILLHVCCAPCSGAIIEKMVADGLKPTLFWSNSNICTAEENARRLEVLKPYAAEFGVPVVEDEYDHGKWLEYVSGELSCGQAALGSYPERGERCAACFRFRLSRAARYAAAEGFDCLTTSLASSRWKSLEQVDDAGRRAVEQLPSVAYWAQNWRKGGLQPRRNEIIRERNFYNQTFCGCEFSLSQSENCNK